MKENTEHKTFEITHYPERDRFETVVDNHTGYVEYDPFDSGIKITHTVVPKAIEGRGIAAALVKASLEYAAKNNLKVIPVCSYVVVYFKRHPEYSELLWTNPNK